MIDVAENPRAVVGDNAPPVIEGHRINIDDLEAEAENFLDGQPIENDGQAEAIARILDHARKAWKAADEQRKDEKRPRDEAGQAVQDAWNPLLKRAKHVETAARAAQTVWLNKKDAELRAAADAARAEADRLRKGAEAAKAAADPSDLSALRVATARLEVASRAEKAADRADKQKAQVAGGSRATGLRTSYRTEVTDMTAFAKWAWATRREEYEGFLKDLAEREGRRGPVSIPGIIVHTERSAA